MVSVDLVIKRQSTALESLVQSLQKMIGLTNLTLVSFIDLSPIFMLSSGLPRLMYLRIVAPIPNIDAVVSHLVPSCPNLKIITFKAYASIMSDKTLRYLTQLRHLTNLWLECMDGGIFSAEAVCSLLSGPSRASLQRVYISFPENRTMNRRMIEDEIKTMSAETGKSTEYEVSQSCISLRR